MVMVMVSHRLSIFGFPLVNPKSPQYASCVVGQKSSEWRWQVDFLSKKPDRAEEKYLWMERRPAKWRREPKLHFHWWGGRWRKTLMRGEQKEKHALRTDGCGTQEGARKREGVEERLRWVTICLIHIVPSLPALLNMHFLDTTHTRLLVFFCFTLNNTHTTTHDTSALHSSFGFSCSQGSCCTRCSTSTPDT